ncbi:hypothetical protein GIV19_19730 [Pseudomonas syringae]|jgi:hypothetical protein|uniref:hypothetical protein n=1 Tax=Pseudomonas syringae TaxID=317 RepID=UPI001F22DFC5|nr:hypothetical protein [Pseudomonas syringae]MCF5709495.1 hypothetical protein [Pseudomonas syringae]
MIELTQDFLKKLAQAARVGLGQDISPDTAQGLNDLKDLALQLLEDPEAASSVAVLHHLDKLLEDPTPAAELRPGFSPKIDADFRLAERDNFFRSRKSLDAQPSPGNTP